HADVAVRLNERDEASLSTLGAALAEVGRLNEAVEAWKRLLALHPQRPDAWSNLGVTYERMGKLADAAAACRYSIALNPNYAVARMNLGSVFSKMGRVDEALGEYQAA